VSADVGGIGIKIGVHCIPVDQMILEEINRYGFDKEYTRKCIETNRHNAAATTYHLLLKQRLRQGFHSHADINSDKFNAKLIMPMLPIRRPQSRQDMKSFIESNIELPTDSNENCQNRKSVGLRNLWGRYSPMPTPSTSR